MTPRPGPRPGPRLDSQWTRAAGYRIHARVSTGEVPDGRPTIVLVHGLVVSSRYMVPIARRLAVDYHVLAPDLPGFGLSEKPRDVLDVPRLAMVLASWIARRGIRRAVILANSAGCQTAAELAVRYPELVDRLILIGPTDATARQTPRQVWRLIRLLPREPAAYIPVLVRDFLDAGPRRAALTFRHMLRHRIEELLPAIRQPTLVVRGSRDPITPQSWAETVARLLPRGRLVVIPGAAHTINYSEPLELARVMRPFVDAAPEPTTTDELVRPPHRHAAARHPANRGHAHRQSLTFPWTTTLMPDAPGATPRDPAGGLHRGAARRGP